MGIIPIPTTDSCTRVQCAHARRWTDTHTCTHTRFIAPQHKGAQESQPAPWPAPPQLPSLTVTSFPVFISPFFFSAPSLAALVVWVSLTLPVCYAAFLLLASLCLFYSHFFSLIVLLFPSSCPSPPPSPTFLDSPSVLSLLF